MLRDHGSGGRPTTRGAPGQDGYTDDCDRFDACDTFSLLLDELSDASESFPDGFVPLSSCGENGRAYDSVALEVRVRVPTNVDSLSFVSNFYTHEYPLWVCTVYNDYFVAMLRGEGEAWRNIVFDAAHRPVSVNNSLLQVCTSATVKNRTFSCPLGRKLLDGTGFDGTAQCSYVQDGSTDIQVGAATWWLGTTAPVSPGEIITIKFAIWDSADCTRDSLVLIDDFTWNLMTSSDEENPEEPPVIKTEPAPVE